MKRIKELSFAIIFLLLLLCGCKTEKTNYNKQMVDLLLSSPNRESIYKEFGISYEESNNYERWKNIELITGCNGRLSAYYNNDDILMTWSYFVDDSKFEEDIVKLVENISSDSTDITNWYIREYPDFKDSCDFYKIYKLKKNNMPIKLIKFNDNDKNGYHVSIEYSCQTADYDESLKVFE